METNTPNYDINPDDERFTTVTTEKSEALTDLEETYGGMISDADKFYKDAVNDIGVQDKNGKWNKGSWADIQTKNQQAQTDFAIQKIEQEKKQARKDYIKEQSGAYVDWQKQSNAYGANAEQMAAQGMTNTGYSESSQVSMYNTYQQRVVAAKDSYDRAVLNYNNAIQEAKLQNNSLLAEIAYQALQQTLELTIQGFQYKNTLLLDKVEKKTALEEMYYQRWQDVLKQINTENALKEEVRQHNAQMEIQNAQLELEREKFNYQKEQDEAKGTISARGGSSGTKITSRPSVSANVQKVKDERAKKEGSNEPVYTIDYDSLTKAGYAGASAATINKAVEEGLLTVTKKNGKLVYSRSPLSRVAGFVP